MSMYALLRFKNVGTFEEDYRFPYGINELDAVARSIEVNPVSSFVICSDELIEAIEEIECEDHKNYFEQQESQLNRIPPWFETLDGLLTIRGILEEIFRKITAKEIIPPGCNAGVAVYGEALKVFEKTMTDMVDECKYFRIEIW